VAVCAGSIFPQAEGELAKNQIPTACLGVNVSSRLHLARIVSPVSNIGQRLGRTAAANLESDFYVVLADSAVGAIAELPREKAIYICNGDLALMFINDGFYSSQRFFRSIAALGMSKTIRRNAAFARLYKVILANSAFSQSFMSYLYGVPIRGFVYPPVNLSSFSPIRRAAGDRYVVAIGRNSSEQNIASVRELSKYMRVRTAGGVRVKGAVNEGVVSDSRLSQLVASAEFAVFPTVSEFFGYSVAEALASGTPVIAFDAAGPREQIEDGTTGWLVRSTPEFIERARLVWDQGVNLEMRRAARSSAERFSVERSVHAILSSIEVEFGVALEKGPL
jgi:Glycosyl transferases group 1